MKKLWKLVLTFAVCAAALCLSAAAVENTAPTRVWGTVSPWDGQGIYLKNDNKDDPFNEVVVNLGEVPIVDAATGLPLEKENIKEGDTLYAWIGPVSTMSLPPQVSAIVAVGNVPADAAVPEYFEISGAPVKGEDGVISFPVLGGETLKVTDETDYTPWLTRQMVRMENLVPGAQVLVWKSGDVAEKVILFAYAYDGQLNVTTESDGSVSAYVNEAIDSNPSRLACKKTADGVVLVPIRAVAESAGYDVRWDRELGAVVSRDEKIVFSVKPGAEVVQTPDGESGLEAPCIIEKGVTYLPAAALAYWLNLFFVE